MKGYNGLHIAWKPSNRSWGRCLQLLGNLQITLGEGEFAAYGKMSMNLITRASETDFLEDVAHELTHRLLEALGQAGQDQLELFRKETGWKCEEKKEECNPETGPTDYSRSDATPNGTEQIVDSEEDLADSLAVSLGDGGEYPLDQDRRDFLDTFFAYTQSIPTFMNKSSSKSPGLSKQK